MRWLKTLARRVALPLALSLSAVLPLSLVLSAPVAAATEPRVEIVATGLNRPWSIAFLPGGGVLVTERNGGLHRIEGIRMSRVSGVPQVLNEGQAGLFDVVADPGFQQNGLIYLSFAHGTRAANGTRIVRAKLVGNSLLEVTPIYTVTPLKRGNVHFGGRMAFLPDGTLAFTTGDGFDFREQAQRLESPLGKVMRITTDGKVPPDNPFVSEAGAVGTIYSRGHRNPQGLAFDPVRGVLFEHEHGPRGGDEVNVIRPGRNYGWPVATLGLDYSGATISPYRRYPGMEDGLVVWVPSIAPSGLAVYRGRMFPEWEGDLLVGALVDKEVRRIRLSPDGKVLGQQSLFRSIGERIRDVRVAPDGSVWVTTDDDKGKVLRISR
ncbi:MAG: glucose dehydrogenase [Sphingomonas sp.]|nr:MAG: glucose dehydrogenase [Sphingomonas sp.]